MVDATGRSAPGSKVLGLSPEVLLFAALAVANASNYLFQVVMSRQMGPQLYSLLGGVYAVITVVGVSTGALQTAAAKASSGQRAAAPASSRDPLLALTLRLGAVVTLALLLASPFISHYLRSGTGPAVSLALYVLPNALLAVGLGRLQGVQAFTALAAASLFLAFARLVLGPLVLAVGLGVTSVVLVSVLTSSLAAAWALRRTRGAGQVFDRGVGAEVSRAGLAVLLFWAIISLDVPHARNVLDEAAAGQYAAAAAIGKAVLWLPGTLSLIMFPRVVRLREETADPLPLLLRTLLGVIALAGAAVAGLFLLGEEVLPIFFGEEYTLAASLAWQVGLACLPFAVVNVLLFYNLTRASNRFLFGLGAALLLEIAALRLVPATPAAVCTVLGTTGSLLLVALVLPGVRRRIIARGADARS